MSSALAATVGFLQREVIDLLRQPALVLLTVLGPFLILFAFGTGYRDEPLVLRAVFVGPPTEAYQDLLDRYQDRFPDTIDPQGYTSDPAAARRQLADGEVDVVVVFPDDPMADVLDGRRSRVTVLHDELNPIQAVAVEFVVRIATDEVNAAVVEELLLTAGQPVQPYRALLDTIADRRAELRAAGGGWAPVVDGLDLLVRQLQRTTDAVESFWDIYGGDPGRAELADFRAQLDAVAATLDDLRGADGSDATAVRQRLDAELAGLEAAAAVITEVDPAVLSRPFVSRTETLTPVDVDEIDFFGAAAVALLVQHLAVSLGALTFVRDRAMGLFELLRVGPTGATEALAGKLLAFVVIGGAAGGALLAGLHQLLDVPLVGPVWWLVVVVGLLLVASIGVGFVLSLVSRSDTQAVQYAMLVLLASLFFSGFFLDHERFNPVAATAARLLPVTSAISGVQDVMLRGRTPSLVDVAVLAALAVITLAASWVLLRRELRTA